MVCKNNLLAYLKPQITRDRQDWKNTMLCVAVSTAFLGLIFISLLEHPRSKEIIIIGGLLLAVNTALICFKSFKTLEIHQVVFWMILVLGIFSLFIQPIGNIPDEFVHIARSEATSRLHFFFPTETDQYGTIQTVIDYMNYKFFTYSEAHDIMSQPIDMTPAVIRTMVKGNLFTVYIPQAVGIGLAKLLRFNMMGMLWMGRLCNLIAYAFVVRLAIKIMPQLKLAMFFIAAMPMSIQQAASCSPDALMNASAFLLIAYFLYLLCGEHLIGRKELVLYTLLSVFVATAKLNNMVFAALILVIPKKRFEKPNTAFIIKWLPVLFTIVCGIGYYAYTQSLPVDSPAPYIIENGVNSAGQLRHIFSNPIRWLYQFVTAMVKNFWIMIDWLHNFGWLNIPVPMLTYMMLFVFGAICIKPSNLRLNAWQKTFVFLIIAGGYFLINFFMYLTWTTVGANNIAGVQGRYLIPLLALLPVTFASNTWGAKRVQAVTEPGELREEISSVQLTRMTAVLSVMSTIMLFAVAVKYYAAV